MAEGTISVEGFTELSKAFKIADKELVKEFRHELREVAEPVRVGAERLAVSEITRLGVPWSRFRVGVTQTSVYVVPVKRGTTVARRKRPNLADLLMGRAMEPALEENIGVVMVGMDEMLQRVGSEWEAV